VKTDETLSIYEQMKRLLRIKLFVLIALGWAAQTFTIGGLSAWGPAVMHELYGVPVTTAAYILGGITVVAGLGFTMIGSVIQDKRIKPIQA
jgi:hypothetical protein